MEQDIRWLQRYDNYHRANLRLQQAIRSFSGPDALSDLEQEGLIKRFEYTYELAWKVMQDLLKYKGYDFMKGPNGTIALALEDGLITDHDGWRSMSTARNLTSHTYDEDEAMQITHEIFTRYAALFDQLDQTLAEQQTRHSL